MPGGDGTGPQGMGPMTGRRMGPCGRGLAQRRGFGRGVGRRFAAEPINLSTQDQKKILEAELAELEAERKVIEQKLKEMK